MSKINKHIEIVSSTEPGLSSMGQASREGARATLAKHYRTVGITIVNNIADLRALVNLKPDLVFLGMTFLPVNPNLGWEDPEKIWLSDYLARFDIAFTGSDREASILERNKHLAKQAVIEAGFSTSPFFVAEQNKKLQRNDIELKYPLFVKPANRGGGLGIDSDSLVHNFDQLKQKVLTIACDHNSDSLIEEYLPGREFSVGILRDEQSDKFLTMPLELIAPADDQGERILSAKVKSQDSEKFVEVLDKSIKSKLSALALGVFKALGANDYGRIDIRLDANGDAYFLEANLLPSLMDGYGNFPKTCWLNNGIDYEAMMLRLVDVVFEKQQPVQSRLPSFPHALKTGYST